jgi:hypothetical protein
MAINFSENLYKFAMDAFARPITVVPLVSQPGAPSYAARAYMDEKATDILTEDGGIFSDSQIYIDIRIEEFPVLPMQGDHIDMAYHEGVRGGSFEVLDLSGMGNAGGMINITLRALVPAKPTDITYQPLP